MIDDMPQNVSMSDGQQFCHVCAHPFAADIQTCPECESPVINVQDLLKSAKRKESPESKKASRKRAIAYLLDSLPLILFRALLVWSLLLVYHLASLANDKWPEIPRIWDWLLVYGIAVFIACVILSGIQYKRQKRYIKQETLIKKSQDEGP